MRDIAFQDIVETVRGLCQTANYRMGADIATAIDAALSREVSPLGREALEILQKNAEISVREQIPLCQDTGLALFFVEMGEGVRVTGGLLEDAINEGTRRGYSEGFLRNSVVMDPLRRNPGPDNTPAIIHLSLVPGDRLKIEYKVVSAGCENMSRMQMLKPSDGIDGVNNFILTAVREAGPSACPPFTVGVGIGGDFELAPLLAKKALRRHVGERHPDPFYAAIETELLEKVNKMGIGPVGLGGRTTAFDLFVEAAPCHIASLPVAVNLACHSNRHKEAVL